MKLKKSGFLKSAMTIVIVLTFIISFKTIKQSLAEEENYSLDAIIYNTENYANGGTGVALTESGVNISEWKFNTSKYLQIDPRVPADGNTYKVQVILPQEMYIVASSITAPAGYCDVNFAKNEAISVNGGGGTYRLKDTSGTATYTMNYMGESGSIQIELRYDTALWDEQKNSSITASGISPIVVKLIKEESGTDTELKKLQVSKITAGNALPGVDYLTYTTTSSTTSSVEILIGNRVSTSYTYAVNDPYSNEVCFFSQITLNIKLPAFTYNGTKYYLGIDESTIRLNAMKTAYNYNIDKSEEGIIKITLSNAYFGHSGTILTFKYNDLPDELKAKDKTQFPMAFTGGNITLYGNGKNGNNNIKLRTKALPSITYLKEATSKVRIENQDITTSITNIPIDEGTAFGGAVYDLGGGKIINSGTGNSGAKTFKYVFDANNTGLIKVTTLNVHADLVSPYITVKYTLVDEDGNRVYLDSNGNRVTIETEGAIGEWEYNLSNSYNNQTTLDNIKNQLNRSMLPVSHRHYYFKTIEYTLEQIKANARIYGTGGTKSLTSAGNFFGYVASTVVNSQKVTSSFSMISTDTSTGVQTVESNKTITTTMSTDNTTGYYISNVAMSKTSIVAGDSCVLSGRITCTDYPYGNGGWLSGIRIGLLLPEGITINSDSIVIKTTNQTVSEIQLTSQAVSEGKVLWVLKCPQDVYIGYAKENLSALASGSYLSFSMQLNTSYTMNATTIFAQEILFAAGLNQKNAAGGSYDWAALKDTYDLNENGSTTDNIAGVKDTNNPSCQIISQNAMLDVLDSVTITTGNSTSQEQDKVFLNNDDDIITYNLKIDSESGGQVQDFMYFIPIPKKTSVVDNFLIEQGGISSGFELALTEEAMFSGKDLFSIQYAFDKTLTYSKAQKFETWYSKEEIEEDSTLNFKDVTMIKLLPKTSIIENGDSSTITLRLKYDGTEFDKEAGMKNKWSSGGYYIHKNGGRETAGNYTTTGVTATIQYYYEHEDITLTASKTGTPSVEGNVSIRTVEDEVFPEFINAQTFSIESIETYAVTLQTRSFINSNKDMAAIDANKTFGITVSINGQPEVDIVNSNLNNEIGSINAMQAPYFTYKIYNGEKLTDNSTLRYIIVTLKSDNEVTYKQKIIINREIEKASDPKSAIVSGKSFIAFDDTTESTTISQNSAFTVQFVTKYNPAIYNTHILDFSNALPFGSTITLVNVTEENRPVYYYYKSDGLTKSIYFNNFIKMGTTNTKDYEYYTDESDIEEKLLFVVDFSTASIPIELGTYNVKMTIKSNVVEDLISKELTFITTNKRTISVSGENSVNFGNEYNLNYEISSQIGAESKFEGRKSSLVITMPNNIPLDTTLIVNGTEYYLNTNKQFIVVLGDIEEKQEIVDMRFVSNMLPDNATNYSCNIAFWISATANGLKPTMGEKIVEKALTLNTTEKIKTALKVTNMNSRIIHTNEIGNDISLTFNYKKVSNCTLTIELMQKVGSGYQKLTDKLNKVGDVTTHNIGVFSISNAINGNNTVVLKLSSNISTGTYRLMLRVNDKDGNEVINVPYNFLIVE